MKKTALIALSVTARFAGSAAMAQADWPERTINVIIGASPGGDTDFNARTMARYFEEITGVNVTCAHPLAHTRLSLVVPKSRRRQPSMRSDDQSE